MGFGLDMTIGKNGGPGTHIYEDKEIPKSRNCPMAYRLIAVYAPSRYSEFPYSVALIGVYRRGFEGPDMRYIAVPIRY
jgi:predicted secreted protein